MEHQNKSYECLIENVKPEFSVFWLITKKNGTQKNVTKYISNNSSKSGDLMTLSSKLTLTLKKKFKELQCVVYFPGKSEFVYPSTKLEMHIKCKFFLFLQSKTCRFVQNIYAKIYVYL